MSDWMNYSLGDIATIDIGGTPSRGVSEFWANEGDDGYPWVSIADLNKRIISETKERITSKGVSNSNVKYVAPGSLIMSFKLSIGRAAIAGVPLFTNEAIASIVPRASEIDSAYLYYILPPEAKNAITDTAVKGATLNKASLAKLKINAPKEVTDQRKIARILQTVDRAIEQTEALIEKYKQIKAGLMHDLFTRGLWTQEELGRGDHHGLPNESTIKVGQLRPPREEAPHLYQETPIGWVPKVWEVTGLAAKAKAGVAHIQTGPFGSSLKGEHWVEVGVPVITIGALGEGEIIESELLHVSGSDAQRLMNYRMRGDEVVFSRVADVGRSIAITKNEVGWIMSSNLMRISLDPAMANPSFLQLQLASNSQIRSQIRCKVNSGGRDVANSEVLNSLLFNWPKPEEQKLIVGREYLVSNRMRNELSLNRKLQKQKSGLMHDLLTGKVPVSVEAEQPEAVDV